MKSGTMDKHRGSTLLKPEENEQVFQLIGNRCQCLAAGIIQLYLTESPLHKEWIKKTTGIITLIRDNPKRSFFLRLYCLQRKAMLWEHEVYNAMDYKAPLTYFHTFEAEDCMAAFNFASETDAVTLRNILLGKLNAKRQRRQQRRSKVEIESQHGATLPWGNQSNTSPIAFSTGSTSNLLNGTPTTVGVNRSASSSSMYKTKKKKRDKAKRKLTKDDIGPPSNFRHLSHLRYIESKGLEFEPDDPHLKIFLDKVGVSEYQFKNQDTRNFIYEFIEKNGGMNAIREDISISTSKPSTQQQSQQQPLPVAPQRQEYPPPVPARTIPKVDKSEIKQKEIPVPGDSRNALLEQIRQGVELRPVVNEVKPKTPPIFQGGLASALSRALAERSSAIHSESDESTSETSDDDEWDD